jgi:hypothetical protein
MERFMIDKHKSPNTPPEKIAVTLAGTVEKVIPPMIPNEPEKVQISVEAAEALYREIRVDNTLHDKQGNVEKLKVGADVEVTIESESKATTATRH